MTPVIFQSLRFKLSCTLGLLVTFAALVVGFINYRIVSYRAHGNLDRDLLEDARFFASRFRDQPDGFDWAATELSPERALKFEELRPYFVIADPHGNIIREDLHSGYARALLAQRNFRSVLGQRSGYSSIRVQNGAIFRFVTIPLPTDRPPAGRLLHLGRSTESVDNALREHLFVYLFALPLILLSSMVVGWFWAQRALKPFDEVARTAEKVTSANLNARITTIHKEIEVERLVQSFNAMVARLHGSFQQMRQFNADAAHELRTPLAILQGENEIALRSPHLPEDVHVVLSSNLEELQRLTRIVNDMLILAEADSGAQVLRLGPVDLKILIQDLIEQMHLIAVDHHVKIELANLPDAVVQGDGLWLRRAFLNLLDNSIKYSRDETKIIVNAQADTHEIRLFISDSGIGIAPEDLPHIFDRLFRADPARTRASGGTGLGLSLVKWIIEAHGGRIQVCSVLGQGTTFEIGLPLTMVPRSTP